MTAYLLQQDISKFDPKAQDAQNGAMAVLKRLIELDGTVALAIGMSAYTPAPASETSLSQAPKPSVPPSPAPAPAQTPWVASLIAALSNIFKRKP